MRIVVIASYGYMDKVYDVLESRRCKDNLCVLRNQCTRTIYRFGNRMVDAYCSVDVIIIEDSVKAPLLGCGQGIQS